MGIVAACVGDEPKASSTKPDASAEGTSSSSGGGSSGTSGTSGADGAADVDATDGPGCKGDTTLEKPDGTTEECRFGCTPTPSPHCGTIYPTGKAITPAMLTTDGVLAKQFSTPTKFDTDTGAIEGVRDGNDDPLTLQVKDGVGFKVANIDATHKIGVWIFESIDVTKDAIVRFTSTNAAGIVVTKTALINGVIDLRSYNEAGDLCKPTAFGQAMSGGPGGGAGSLQGKPGGGPGGGYGPNTTGTFYVAGTGGAGFGGAGGQGGLRDAGPAGSNNGPGGDGGASYGEPTLDPLLGGSGGSGFGSLSGGGGGGAFHLVAGQQITIGDGTSKSGINAGGCQGVDPQMGSPGGGGGSGGSILLEAPLLDIKQNAGLATNGATGAPGFAGKLENSSTQALQATGGYGTAGSGGGGTTANGGNGIAMAAGGLTGGAGGGAAGRIRINTRTGNFVPLTTAVLSPSLEATGKPSTVGKLDVR